MLLLHGTADERVPVTFSTDFAAALTAAGHPVTLTVLPGEDHDEIYDAQVAAADDRRVAEDPSPGLTARAQPGADGDVVLTGGGLDVLLGLAEQVVGQPAQGPRDRDLVADLGDLGVRPAAPARAASPSIASGASASRATVAVVSSPCSKMVTRTDHSRSVPSPGSARLHRLRARVARPRSPSARPRSREHRAGVPVLPAHDVRRSPVGAAGLEHLPGASGLVDPLARQDDPVSGCGPHGSSSPASSPCPGCRGGGDGHGTHPRLSSSPRPMHTPRRVVGVTLPALPHGAPG